MNNSTLMLIFAMSLGDVKLAKKWMTLYSLPPGLSLHQLLKYYYYHSLHDRRAWVFRRVIGLKNVIDSVAKKLIDDGY